MNSETTANSVGGNHGGIGSKIKKASVKNVRGTILGGVDTVLHKDSTANDAIAAKGRNQFAEGTANLRGGSANPAVPVNRQNPATHNAQGTGGAFTTGTNYDGDGAGGYSGTQNSGAPVPATAPTGNDPYFNKVNQEANLAHHDAGTAGDQYNPYHDSAGTRWHKNIPAYDGPGNAQQHARGDRPIEEPRHHRDDAISGDPTAGQAGRGVPPQYVSATGGPPTDVRAQYPADDVI
ncbi:hypothetical protein B0H14DRAFT_2759515 [Mycena olivaceomarginata]|nr:hypothetical protein B0H14DRAFT_2759515 [Mycena olivaceomarginata]